MRDDRGWGGTAPPGVVFHYRPGRKGEYAAEILAGFDGTIQVDAYGAYTHLATPKRTGGAPLRLAFCWAHGRRKRIRAKSKNQGQAEESRPTRRKAHRSSRRSDIQWCAADPHYSHDRIIGFCDRPFGDVATMNAHLLAECRARVQPDDDLWILGDSTAGRSTDAQRREVRGIFHALRRQIYATAALRSAEKLDQKTTR